MSVQPYVYVYVRYLSKLLLNYFTDNLPFKDSNLLFDIFNTTICCFDNTELRIIVRHNLTKHNLYFFDNFMSLYLYCNCYRGNNNSYSCHFFIKLSWVYIQCDTHKCRKISFCFIMYIKFREILFLFI